MSLGGTKKKRIRPVINIDVNAVKSRRSMDASKSFGNNSEAARSSADQNSLAQKKDPNVIISDQDSI